MAKKQAAKPSKKRKSTSGEKNAASSPQKAAKRERKPGELSRFQKGVIILFIAVFALSTLASAFAALVQSQQAQTITYDVDYVDSMYEESVAELETQVAEDPSNADALLSLAQSCNSWGSLVGMLAADDEEVAHGTELLERAIGYYDQYLELNDTAEARTERAMCYYYMGDAETAMAELKAVTESTPDYAAAWYDLGTIYEYQGGTEDAIAAYERAVELDPDDESGVKSSAESRLSSLQGADAEGEATDTEATDTAGESADATDVTDAADDASTTQTDDSSAAE